MTDNNNHDIITNLNQETDVLRSRGGSGEAVDSSKEGNTVSSAKTSTTSQQEESTLTSSPDNNHITADDLKEIQTDLAKSLEEESTLLNLQMKLTVQLEELNKKVAAAETQEKLAQLALQQAKVARLLQSGGTDEDEEDTVTIRVYS